jgi:hypothetical protein
MTKSVPSVNEIVSTLKRSTLPTIVVEGTADVYIYRFLKSKLKNSLVGIQPCGGRSVLFSIHDRKEEFSGKNVVFVADLDAYRFDGIPHERQDIIFTAGYCIENDIYDGADLDNYLEEDDANHSLLQSIVVKWFAFELEKYRGSLSQNKSLSVSDHINNISPDGLGVLCPDFCRRIGYSDPTPATIAFIKSELNLNVRGKQLFQMLARFTSKKNRFSKLNENNLIEIALRQTENPNIVRIVDDINQFLPEQ